MRLSYSQNHCTEEQSNTPAQFALPEESILRHEKKHLKYKLENSEQKQTHAKKQPKNPQIT